MGIVCMVPPSLGAAKASARSELMAAALSKEFGRPVEPVVAETYAELERQANASEVDIVWCPSAICANLTHARDVFTVVRGGVSSYRSAIIARREDRLNVSHLGGKVAAWVDPLWAGGYVLAIALLRSRGVSPERTFSKQSFLGTHRAVALAVLQKDADVGALSVLGFHDDQLEEMMRWYVGPPGERLEALAVSELCPNDALVVTSKLPDDLAQQCSSSFTRAHTAGSQLLFALEAERMESGDLNSYRRAFSQIARKTMSPPNNR